jgi:hypothetical protein
MTKEPSMRLLQRLGIISTIFGLVVMAGQVWVDLSFLQSDGKFVETIVSFRGMLAVFVQGLWLVFLAGSIAMAFQSYWGRWAVALSSLLLLGELLSFDILPNLSNGWEEALYTMSITWPGVVMGRGPITFVVLLALTCIVILKGLARRPSSERRGAAGEHLRTRETDRTPVSPVS